jgi:TIR domain
LNGADLSTELEKERIGDLPPIRIVISYRREDTAGGAGRLRQDLGAHFGREQVFLDIDTIPPGVDWLEEIEKTVSSADVLLPLIGLHWLTVTDENGQRRLDDPNDVLRLEIETALKTRVRVIPIQLHGAPMPKANQLPESLVALTRRQSVRIDDEDWPHDVQKLVRALERIKREKAEALQAQAVEREAAERAERERLEQEAAEQEAAERERLEREAAERAERIRLERDAVERERAQREEAEREAAERERAEREKAARDRAAREKTRGQRPEPERPTRDWLRPSRQKRFSEGISRLLRKRRVQVSLIAAALASAGAVVLVLFATQEEGTHSTAGSEPPSQSRNDPFKQLRGHIPPKVGGCEKLILEALAPGDADDTAAAATCNPALKGVGRVLYSLLKSSSTAAFSADYRLWLLKDIKGEVVSTRGACTSFTGVGTYEKRAWSLRRQGGTSGHILCSWDEGPRQSLLWTTAGSDVYAQLLGKPGRRTPLYPDPWKIAVPVP